MLIYSVTLWAFESMAQALSTLFRNPLLGMLLFICAWCAPTAVIGEMTCVVSFVSDLDLVCICTCLCAPGAHTEIRTDRHDIVLAGCEVLLLGCSLLQFPVSLSSFRDPSSPLTCAQNKALTCAQNKARGPAGRFASFLFSGFFITESSLEWPLRIFMYIMPHRWSLASMVRRAAHRTMSRAYPALRVVNRRESQHVLNGRGFGNRQ